MTTIAKMRMTYADSFVAVYFFKDWYGEAHRLFGQSRLRLAVLDQRRLVLKPSFKDDRTPGTSRLWDDVRYMEHCGVKAFRLQWQCSYLSNLAALGAEFGETDICDHYIRDGMRGPEIHFEIVEELLREPYIPRRNGRRTA